ncbi:methylated-DNA-[protein]-cysteine S-methyltransferase [Devosia lucknowensis]|uniref:methylated-DNA--[protein]-cysteine S-methyltransferase n=1 Tax=Devosia lucknowensis TaxID=1096929 RepID=A0A1Y6EYM9_9HYPH|nr:methylated-DNA--[protein]-cysteine S-methyltransferase [Devosia lucknowensis]SMQ66170.1 methylated-DNA-[protein]-cysteine S-methyltransferase [Devosia lucknowensis]
MQVMTFETALGRFGIGWTDRGLARVLLPGDDEPTMLERLLWDGATVGEPDRAIGSLVDRIEDYAEGERVSFDDVALDFGAAPDFHRRAYDLLVKVRWGETLTYGDLARRLGDANLSRAVGRAMGANPIPLVVPCHRVLASNGKPGGFSAPGGAASKVRMLALEGVSIGAPVGQLSFGFS